MKTDEIPARYDVRRSIPFINVKLTSHIKIPEINKEKYVRLFKKIIRRSSDVTFSLTSCTKVSSFIFVTSVFLLPFWFVLNLLPSPEMSEQRSRC